MIDILQTIKNHLQSEASVTIPIKIGFMADTPDDVVAIYYLEGDNPNVYFAKTSGGISRPRVRIRIRATSYPTAYQCAVSIRSALIGFKLGDTLGIFADGDIVPTGQDEVKRTTFELNYRALINE